MPSGISSGSSNSGSVPASGAEFERERGKVWLIGAGPGDPGLITVKGRRVLSQADVVLYDALSHPALLAACRADAELRDVGKRAGRRSPPQEFITAQLIALAREGKRVARLKGGDPFLFARGAEEAEALAEAGIPFEIVPGISSPVATSAYAGISMTHRDLSSSVTFITGSDREGKPWSPAAWQKLATATDTLCIVMGMRRLEVITEALMQGGRSPDTPAAVVQWGSWAQQRVLVATLATVAEAARNATLTNPAVVIVGEVVTLREKLQWFDKLPLFGKRLLVPRAVHQAQATADAIRERGADPEVFPVIEMVSPPEPARVAAAIDALVQGAYEWVLFTSANGVTRFFEALSGRDRDARAFGPSRVGVIGPKTAAALSARGIRPDLCADDYVGEGLARAVIASSPSGPGRVLIPRALEARDALPRALEAAGGTVDVVPVYETKPASDARREELIAALDAKELDAILFTSSSTVDALVALLGERAGELLRGVDVACIGPVTRATAEGHGLAIAVHAERYTVDGLLDALAEFYAAARRSA